VTRSAVVLDTVGLDAECGRSQVADMAEDARIAEPSVPRNAASVMVIEVTPM
jgi:hypothetical protein